MVAVQTYIMLLQLVEKLSRMGFHIRACGILIEPAGSLYSSGYTVLLFIIWMLFQYGRIPYLQ